jgi:hypothetical protein
MTDMKRIVETANDWYKVPAKATGHWHRLT